MKNSALVKTQLFKVAALKINIKIPEFVPLLTDT